MSNDPYPRSRDIPNGMTVVAVEYINALEEVAESHARLMEWRDYETDPEGYSRAHDGWVPLPWRMAHIAVARLDAARKAKSKP